MRTESGKDIKAEEYPKAVHECCRGGAPKLETGTIATSEGTFSRLLRGRRDGDRTPSSPERIEGAQPNGCAFGDGDGPGVPG